MDLPAITSPAPRKATASEVVAGQKPDTWVTPATLKPIIDAIEAEFTDIPAPNKVPRALGTGKIADGWLSSLVARVVDITWANLPDKPSGLPPTGGAGGVLSGNYPNPGFAVDMATQAELDAVNLALTNAIALKLGLAGGTLTGALTLAADPATALGAATKQYVDNIAAGLNVKLAVAAATTANITLSGTQTIDGIAVVAGNRVLVKNQTTPAQNGIYMVAAGAWTRSTDMDSWAEVPGGFCFVTQGTTQDDTGWVCTANPGGTLGTTAITWTQYAGAGAVTGGTGITVTGNQVSLAAVATGVLLGNVSGSSAAPSALNASQVKTLLAITAADITNASANGRSLLTAANYAAMKALLAIDVTEVSGAVSTSRAISGGGLVTGGGNLSADRTLTVTAASNTEAITGTETAKAMTPAGNKAALDARLAALLEREGLRFTGSEYSTIGNSGIPAVGTGDFTVICLLSKKTASDTPAPIWGSSTHSLGVVVRETTLTIDETSVGTAFSAAYSTPIDTPTIYHFKREAGIATIGVNGATVSSGAMTTNFSDPSEQFGRFGPSLLSRVLFFNRALSASEITALINRGLVTLPEQRLGSISVPSNFTWSGAADVNVTSSSASSTGITVAKTLTGGGITYAAVEVSNAAILGPLGGLPAVPNRTWRISGTLTYNSGSGTIGIGFSGQTALTISATGAFSGVITNGSNTNPRIVLYAAAPVTDVWNVTLTNFSIVPLGTLFELGNGQRNAGYQIKDTSGARRDVTIPASGVEIIDPDPRGGSVRGSLSWSGTHEVKSLFGQIALPANARVTRITTTATTASSGSGLNIGCNTDQARYVGYTTFSTGKMTHTILNGGLPPGSSGPDLSIVIDPDTANYTGTIEIVVDYSLI